MPGTTTATWRALVRSPNTSAARPSPAGSKSRKRRSGSSSSRSLRRRASSSRHARRRAGARSRRSDRLRVGARSAAGSARRRGCRRAPGRSWASASATVGSRPLKNAATAAGSGLSDQQRLESPAARSSACAVDRRSRRPRRTRRRRSGRPPAPPRSAILWAGPATTSAPTIAATTQQHPDVLGGDLSALGKAAGRPPVSPRPCRRLCRSRRSMASSLPEGRGCRQRRGTHLSGGPGPVSNVPRPACAPQVARARAPTSSSMRLRGDDRRVVSVSAAAIYSGAAFVGIVESVLPGGEAFSVLPAAGALLLSALIVFAGPRVPRLALAALGPARRGDDRRRHRDDHRLRRLRRPLHVARRLDGVLLRHLGDRVHRRLDRHGPRRACCSRCRPSRATSTAGSTSSWRCSWSPSWCGRWPPATSGSSPARGRGARSTRSPVCSTAAVSRSAWSAELSRADARRRAARRRRLRPRPLQARQRRARPRDRRPRAGVAGHAAQRAGARRRRRRPRGRRGVRRAAPARRPRGRRACSPSACGSPSRPAARRAGAGVRDSPRHCG